MDAANDPDGTIAAFVRAAGFEPETIVECVQFGDQPDVRDALAELVVSGSKRATTSQYRWYGEDGERLPVAGDLFVVLDAARRPRCVCRTSAVEIRPFAYVDAAFAWDEGEADRMLNSWRAIHEKYFADEAALGGFTFSGESLVVLHRFERAKA